MGLTVRGIRLAARLRESGRDGTGDRFFCGLTFELSGRQRQDARPGLAKMYRVPPTGPWWPAVGPRLERGVRPHSRAAHR